MQKQKESKSNRAAHHTKKAAELLAPTRKKRRFWPRPAVSVALGAALGLCAIIWITGNAYYSRIAIGDRVLAGHISDKALLRATVQAAGVYRLAITYPDNSAQRFPLSAIGLKTNALASIQAVRRDQHSLTHRLVWWRPVRVTLLGTVRTNTLQTFVARHALIVQTPARNAAIRITNGAVYIDGGVLGKGSGLIDANTTILDAVRSLQAAPLTLRPVAIEPAVTAGSLVSTKTQLEAILKQHITIDIAGQTVAPTPSDIAAWVGITPDATGFPSLSVDTGKLAAYLQSVGAANTKQASPQVLSASGTVVVAGQKGVAITGVDEAVTALAASLLKHGGAHVSLATTTTPFKTVTAPTSGKWIEVDVTLKRLYAYDQTGLVRSYLVTAGAPATPTVIGHFAIYAKYASQNMFGENVDGTPYYQPNVPYVNYFYADYAIRGNYWRPSSYFGFVNSSHGCVGLPVSDSSWLYSWAPIGTPVIVHT